MADLVRLGAIGLGRAWESRHRPALLASSDRFRVAGVYDQVGWRADLEARQLGCVGHQGAMALLSSPEVDAIALLSPQWHGAWALKQAAQGDKPIYLALGPGERPEDWIGPLETIAERGLPICVELTLRACPATLRLREVLSTRLGAPRLIVGGARAVCETKAGPGQQDVPLWSCPGADLVDWCAHLFESSPAFVTSHGGASEADEVHSHRIEFPNGLAELRVVGHPPEDRARPRDALPPNGLEVHAERGTAWVEFPDHIVWRDETGRYEERLSERPGLGERLLDQFHRLVTGRSGTAPGVAEALALVRGAIALREALQGGGRVPFARSGAS